VVGIITDRDAVKALAMQVPALKSVLEVLCDREPGRRR
jgi:hypothetical protein